MYYNSLIICTFAPMEEYLMYAAAFIVGMILYSYTKKKRF